MGWYADHVLPRIVDKLCASKDLRPLRVRGVEGLRGNVVEIGFGSGLNVPLYPDEVVDVRAVEPSLLARRLASGRVTASPIPVSYVGLDGQQLPLEDESCDAALSTFTLCTIPDVAAALDEVRRVLRPGGSFHFVEHGLSPDPEVARRQRRFEPVQKRLGGGCHLTRDPVALVRAAGFEVQRSDSEYIKGPKPLSWFTVGLAVKPA